MKICEQIKIKWKATKGYNKVPLFYNEILFITQNDCIESLISDAIINKIEILISITFILIAGISNVGHHLSLSIENETAFRIN